jgi:high-affinity iron transporter
MAFLAVLREGFETSVFLLATITNAGSAPAAMWGAVLGIVVACGLGWGIYKGGVKLNLHRFFQITGAFLVLVAAGLTLMVFRTAHEAGWITVGQGRTVDLGWLAPNGSIRSALLSGVLGIPNDPRVIEVAAWLCFLVPVALFVYWPQRWRLSGNEAQTFRVASAGVLVAAGALLMLLVSPVAAASADVSATSHPSSLTLTQLLTYTGHRVPVGLNAAAAPGPYDATWQATSQPGTELLTLTGGGLSSPRALTVADPAASAAPVATDWRVTRGDQLVFKYWLPAFLGLLALGLLLVAVRSRTGSATAPVDASPGAAPTRDQKGKSHHAYASSEV